MIHEQYTRATHPDLFRAIEKEFKGMTVGEFIQPFMTKVLCKEGYHLYNTVKILDDKFVINICQNCGYIDLLNMPRSEFDIYLQNLYSAWDNEAK